MNFPDHSPFVPPPGFPADMNSIGLWPQFPIPNEQQDLNAQFDHGPPFKRPKSSEDNPRMPRANTPVVNQPIGKIFFKTRLCAKFRMGQCRNGENCNFAHGEEDLRKPPPNWQELVAGRPEDRGNNGNWDDDDRIIHRMKLCKKFYNGEECPYGDRCNFLHKEPPKFRDGPARFRDNSRESSAISIGTTGTPMSQGNGSDQIEIARFGNAGMDVLRVNTRAGFWKRRLCTKWELTGQCPFGEKCHFAHGQAELILSRPTEGELQNTSLVMAKALSAPVSEPPAATKAESGAPSSQEVQEKKCLFNMKGTKKINRIYADWLDDLPLYLPNDVTD